MSVALKYSLKERQEYRRTLKEQRDRKLAEQNGRCAYCLCKLTSKTATRDHIRSKAAGGTNHYLNMVVACYTCNNAKGHMHVSEFRKKIRAPKRGDHIAYHLIWIERNINRRLIAMERNVLMATRGRNGT